MAGSSPPFQCREWVWVGLAWSRLEVEARVGRHSLGG